MVTYGNNIQTNGAQALNVISNICTVVGAVYIVGKTASIAYQMGERNMERKFREQGIIIDGA